jgi:hypothetical protein
LAIKGTVQRGEILQFHVPLGSHERTHILARFPQLDVPFDYQEKHGFQGAGQQDHLDMIPASDFSLALSAPIRTGQV